MTITATATVIDFEVTDPSDFTAIDDLALSNGMRGWCSLPGASLGLWILDQNSLLPSNGVTVVPTLSGTGNWLLMVSGSSVPAPISVPDISALGLLPDAAFADGVQVFVLSVRSWWFRRIEPDLGNANGITIERSFSNAATWYRDQEPHRSWRDQVFFFADGVTGDDENDGTTPATALLTLDELSRRVNGQEPRGPFALTIITSANGVLELNQIVDSQVTITGEPIPIASAPVTAVVPLNEPVNQRQVVDAVLPWSTDHFVANTTAGTHGYVISNPIPGVSAETKFFDATFTQLNPADGNLLEEFDVPTMTGEVIAHGARVAFNLLRLGSLFTRFQVDDANIEDSDRVILTAVALKNLRGFRFTRSILRGSIGTDGGRYRQGTLAASVLGAVVPLIVVGDSVLELRDNTTLVDRGALRAISGGGIVIAGVTEVRDTVTDVSLFSPFEVTEEGWISILVDLNDVNDVLYGDNNAGPILAIVTNNARATYASIPPLIVTSVALNWSYPGASGNWAALPSSNPANFVGIVPRL